MIPYKVSYKVRFRKNIQSVKSDFWSNLHSVLNVLVLPHLERNKKVRKTKIDLYLFIYFQAFLIFCINMNLKIYEKLDKYKLN